MNKLLLPGAVFFFLVVGSAFLLPGSGITGNSIDTIVMVMITNDSICMRDFEQGWNLVSIPCLPENRSVESVFTSVQPDLLSIHEYKGGDDPWDSYRPDLPAWVEQGVQPINRTKGYWINMAGNSHFELDAQVQLPNQILLHQGWNLAGYPTFMTRSASYLDSIAPDFDRTVLFNATTQSWMAYSWNNSVTGMNVLAPYHGYFIYAHAPTVWVVS